MMNTWTPRRAARIAQDEKSGSLERQAAMLKALVSLPEAEAIGVACSILLQASYDCPHVLRRVLMEPVVREGFRGEPLAATLARVARS